MSQFNFGERLVFCEQKVDVLQKDLAANLNKFATTLNQLIQVNRTFQVYVSTRLDEISNRTEELRKHAGIEWQRDIPVPEAAGTERTDGAGAPAADQGQSGSDQLNDGRHETTSPPASGSSIILATK